MKKLFLVLLIAFMFLATPVFAVTKSNKLSVWKPVTPEGYTPITWATAPGIASFFKAPADNGSIDFLTRIYLPKNQIDFIVSETPVDAGPANPNFTSNILTSTAILDQETSQSTNNNISSTTATTTIDSIRANNFRNLSFQRFVAEAGKKINPAIKFIWDAPFFNMKPSASDLSMAVKYSSGPTTIVSSGSRSIPDMAEERRMFIVNNQTGTARIEVFEPSAFLDDKDGDQALEAFAPTVLKSDSSASTAPRLFLGVSDDGHELVVYCSQKATSKEASSALLAAGISVEHQLQADGGGSATCGYNLPGQFFVEPTRTLPVLMGAMTILARGNVATKILNVRSGPASKYPVITTLSKGVRVRVYEEKNGWYRVGKGQWVKKTLIKTL